MILNNNKIVIYNWLYSSIYLKLRPVQVVLATLRSFSMAAIMWVF